MHIKRKLVLWTLLGFISLAKAENINYINYIDRSKSFGDLVVNVIDTQNKKADQRYKILIAKKLDKKVSTTNKAEQFEHPIIKEVGEIIWTIDPNQMPITESDCNQANIDTCSEEDSDCYKFCFTNLPPLIIDFDKKTNKLYFMIGSHEIGTGGGSAFLFSADVTKKEVKFVNIEPYGNTGILSPSGKYLVFDGLATVSVINTQNNSKFYTNKSENDYTENKQKRHYMYFKEWLSDTQFSYVDVGRHFTHKTEPAPFISAKEVIYDIPSNKAIKERNVTKAEYQLFDKDHARWEESYN